MGRHVTEIWGEDGRSTSENMLLFVQSMPTGLWCSGAAASALSQPAPRATPERGHPLKGLKIHKQQKYTRDAELQSVRLTTPPAFPWPTNKTCCKDNQHVSSTRQHIWWSSEAGSPRTLCFLVQHIVQQGNNKNGIQRLKFQTRGVRGALARASSKKLWTMLCKGPRLLGLRDEIFRNLSSLEPLEPVCHLQQKMVGGQKVYHGKVCAKLRHKQETKIKQGSQWDLRRLSSTVPGRVLSPSVFLIASKHISCALTPLQFLEAS